MADNTTLPLGTEDGDTYASDDIAGVKIQRVKFVLGADGVNDGDASDSNPVPVTGGLTDTQLRASAVPISVATVPSHAVTNAGTFAVQASIAAAQTLATVTTLGTVTNVVHVDDNSGNLSIDDGGNSITVDGTVAVSGTVTVGSHAVTNAGTFAVQAAEADGANVTLGAKADAKSTATDTTAITAMSVLKQISASVQAPPSQAVTNAGTFAVQAAATEADGANVTLGAKADAKSTATDTTAITAMSVLKQISASVQAPPSQAVTNAGTFVTQIDGAALTSLQLADDVVYTDDTSTHATGTSKGTLFMAAATPTDSSVDANDIGAVAMTTDRKLLVKNYTNDGSGNTIGSTANALDVNIKSDGVGRPTAYTEDAVSSADPVATMLMSRRTDTLSASEVSSDRDNIIVNATSKGELYVKQTDNVTVAVAAAQTLATVTTVGTVTTITNTVPTKETRSATPTQTSVANSATNVTVVASNANRLGVTIFNDDTAGTGATLKLKLGATASSSSFTVAIAPQGYYEVPFGYTGIIDGIASAGTGNARITELTA